jgi:translation initiation factor IF-3
MNLKDKKEESKALLNENIPFSRVLLVSEDGKEKKEITRLEALNQAKKSGLDLFCVAPSAVLPVCKLVNYYQLSKKKKKTKESICKGIDISFNIAENDLKEVKLKKIKN